MASLFGTLLICILVATACTQSQTLFLQNAFAGQLDTFNAEVQSADEPNPDVELCLKYKEGLEKKASTGHLAERSLSPWRYIKNFDSRRSQDDLYIVDTACACLGCFVPKKDDPHEFVYTESLISVPIAFKRNVKMAGGETVNVTTHMGCQCQFPRYTTNAGDQPIVESVIW